jgi:Ser/Thr protein kinase RdoA (MazF antagonist)
MSSLPASRPTVPVVTDTTAATQEELEEASSFFLDPVASGPLSFTRCSGGVNNKCYTVFYGNGQPLGVLRIYANGNNSARVRYEHEVLRQLQERIASLSPIELPCPMCPRDGSKLTFSTMSSGAEACFFNFIKGKGPDLKSARSIGYATARLSKVMADVKVDEVKFPRCNPIYQNLWEAHWKITEASFYEVVNSSVFEGVRKEMDFLVDEIKRLEALVVEILKEDCLPRQQLHADLHTDNCLVDEETAEVTGILDFEFTAYDWRVMELVVGISKYAGIKEPEGPMMEYIEGYKSAGGKLTKRECELVPDLISLRILNNVVYFVGRGLSGEDSYEPITGRAGVYGKRVVWLQTKKDWLIEQCLQLV